MNPQFVDYSYNFITKIISVIQHIYLGVEVKNVKSNAGAQVTGSLPNETNFNNRRDGLSQI